MTDETTIEEPRYQRKHKSGVRNTAGRSSLHKRLTAQMDGILAHLEQHPNDVLSRQRVDRIKYLLSKGG